MEIKFLKMNSHIKFGQGVGLIACQGKLTQDRVLTSLTLFDAYRSLAAHVRLTL